VIFKILATAALAAHFCFLAYVIFGGFLAWRWPRAFWPHLVAAAWGLAVVSVPLACPLTYLENWARLEAGESGLTQGFIDRYIEGVLYPQQYTRLLQVAVAVMVLGSWLGTCRRYRTRRTTARAIVATNHPDTAHKSEDSSERAATV
jgi:Protein of Unknown function (DUF2784)